MSELEKALQDLEGDSSTEKKKKQAPKQTATAPQQRPAQNIPQQTYSPANLEPIKRRITVTGGAAGKKDYMEFFRSLGNFDKKIKYGILAGIVAIALAFGGYTMFGKTKTETNAGKAATVATTSPSITKTDMGTSNPYRGEDIYGNALKEEAATKRNDLIERYERVCDFYNIKVKDVNKLPDSDIEKLVQRIEDGDAAHTSIDDEGIISIVSQREQEMEKPKFKLKGTKIFEDNETGNAMGIRNGISKEIFVGSKIEDYTVSSLGRGYVVLQDKLGRDYYLYIQAGN